jgi:hypothetical protein
MKKNVKKVVVYSLLIGSAQFGLSTAVLEASPKCDKQEYKQQNESRQARSHRIQQESARSHRIQQENARSYRIQQEIARNKWIQQENERNHRIQEENARHERELRQRDYENYREWQARQEREKQRHDNTMNEIKAGLIGLIIGSMID